MSTATASQKKASAAHRRRALARGLVRVEVHAAKGDAGLVRTLAETLRGDSFRAKTLRAALTQALVDPEVVTAFDLFGSDLPDEVFDGAFDQPRQKGLARGQSVKFILDANVISEIRKGERAHPSVASWVVRTPVKEMGTSVLVLAEIRRGIERKRRQDTAQADALDRWFRQMRPRIEDRVLPIDEPIAEAWALMSVLDPLPLIDGLLAATAKVHGLILVTRNAADVARTGVAILDPFKLEA